MYKSVLLLIFLSIFISASAQEVNVLLKEAENFDKTLKENEALEKYKQVILLDAKNTFALVRAAELCASIGGRAEKKDIKKLYFETSLAYAQRAVEANASSADAYYALAMASGKMTELDIDNKRIVDFVKDIKVNVEKALSINQLHAKSNYIMGKWHLEVYNLNGIKKAAVKVLYGGLPQASLDSAIYYMEKCRNYDMYFMLNYTDLAKAYQQDNQVNKQIEVLQKIVKLPLRTADDAALKAQAQKQLQSLL